ncbi:MAG: protein kinase, partial [Calditrichaeota bacterium]|nr:protein kinase [Calditrichota bacterium]
MKWMVGKSIDHYRIQSLLGQGGMGAVFKATDENLDMTVALKIMDPRLYEDKQFVKRFRSEAKALARLESPHIVKVHALRESEYGLYIVMEYVDGETLADQ